MAKKRISEMTPEEAAAQRALWAAEKRQERNRKREAVGVPTADEFREEFSRTQHYKELTAYAKQFANKVEGELGKEIGNLRVRTGSGAHDYYDDDGQYTFDRLSRTLLGLKRNWVREVRDPDGELVAGSYFADPDCDFASDLIESVYRHGLKQSPTFAASFRELLELLGKRFKRHRDTRELAVIQAELNGTYVYVPPALPVTPKPKPASQMVEAKPEPQAVTQEAAQVPNVTWSQVNRHLDEQARRYLDGI